MEQLENALAFVGLIEVDQSVFQDPSGFQHVCNTVQDRIELACFSFGTVPLRIALERNAQQEPAQDEHPTGTVEEPQAAGEQEDVTEKREAVA